GRRAGEFAAKFAKENQHGAINNSEIENVVREALRPFEQREGENPYILQRDLQETMQDNVGIVRTEAEMKLQLEHLRKLWERASRVGVSGNREFNPGWHTALDLKNLLTVSEAVTRAALERKESRGGHFRDDFPKKEETYAKFNIVTYRGPDGAMQIRHEPVKPMPP